MNEKNYSCPFCSQTSARKWNIRIHIVRRHHGTGEAIRIKSREATNSRFSTTDDNVYKKYSIPNESYRSRSFARDLEIGTNDPLEATNGLLRQVAEHVRLVEEIAPIPRWHDSFNMSSPISAPPPQLNRGIPDLLCSKEYTPKTDPFRHRILGYENYMCNQCLVTEPLPFFGIDGSRVSRSRHGCNLKRKSKIERLSREEKNKERLNLYFSMPKFNEIKEGWTDGKSLYLTFFKLSWIPSSSYEFTFLLEQGCEWLSKAIRGKSICLDDSQLEEFLFHTKGNTYASSYITIKQGGSETIESYFMTLSKEPLRTIPFYISNPQILPKCLAIGGDFTLY